ncbi:MAG: hypothetical protein P4L72_06540 [Parvibaculum sp.]|uniref:hypothetical protein n=1 Tax=Parvibaculum sp. TaxID=2024848 RepID=UPI002846352A|nr:hypothetical protein [Parvibaculum sp.]MDR3498868.1 hypothetical protein [Parvibaculum sp.]
MTTDGIEPPVGFPHLKYAQIERERRWLCDAVPEAALRSGTRLDIVDLYIPGSALRLRSAEPLDGGVNYRRLSKKVQLADPRHRLITTLYLSEGEHARLQALGGLVLKKRRINFERGGRRAAVDIFEPPLKGLILAEIEFDDDVAMTTYAMPEFARLEVTDDARYSGFALARLAASPNPDISSLIGETR